MIEQTLQPINPPDVSLRSIAAVTPSGSPFVFTAPSDGAVILQLGAVSLIEYGRIGAYITIGLTAGMIELSKNDTLRVTYAVAPTLNFIPR